MKKDYNTKKKAIVIVLSFTAICFAGGLFYYVSLQNNSIPPILPAETPPLVESQVIVPEIKPDSTHGDTDDSSADSDTPSVDGDVREKPSAGKPKTPEEATPPAEPPKTVDGKDKTPPKSPDKKPATSTDNTDTGKDHESAPENPSKPPKTADGKDKTPPKSPDKKPATSKGNTDTGKDHEFTPEDPSKPPEYKQEQTEPNKDTSKPKDGDKKDGKIYIEGFGWIKDEGGGSDVKEAPNAGTGKPVGDM